MASKINVFRKGKINKFNAALARWGFAYASEMQQAQIDGDFVATGESLDNYTLVINESNIYVQIPSYLQYSWRGKGFEGRHPGGGRAPIQDLVKWINAKNLKPKDGGSILSFAWAIAIKQQAEGNQVFRKDREGIPIDVILDESFEKIKNEAALEYAVTSMDELLEGMINDRLSKIKVK